MAETIVFRGELTGHNGWITSIASTQEDPNMILTSSRDKVLP
jgi:guanine nucleotide-binding protein subunit beta-2-like 1 protein